MVQQAGNRVMLVEDDVLFATTLQRYLEKRSMHVEHESRGDLAGARIRKSQPDAVVLDGNLPGKDGFEICREVRAGGYRGIILMLTARVEDMDRILGLELGADGYILKPAVPNIVFAHLSACMRARDVVQTAEPEDFRFGQFMISRTTREVMLAGRVLELSTADFDMLWLLASHAGTVLSRDDINGALRGLEYDGLNRQIDMRISRLRTVLGDNAEMPMRIKTVRGKGYLFSSTDWE